MRLRLLSHNVYWFQGHPFSGDQPKEENPSVLEQLSALYAQKKVDLLCLQEVQSEEVAHRFLAASGLHGFHTPGNLYPLYGGMIAARDGLTLVRRELKPSPLRERSLLSATLSGFGGALEISNLHLTSGRQSGNAGAGAARVREIEAFLAVDEARSDLLVGDFNENRDGGAVSEILEAHGFIDTALACGQEAISASAKGNARTDMIWIHERRRKHLAGYGVVQEELAIDTLPGKTFLSDHRPIWIDLEL